MVWVARLWAPKPTPTRWLPAVPYLAAEALAAVSSVGWVAAREALTEEPELGSIHPQKPKRRGRIGTLDQRRSHHHPYWRCQKVLFYLCSLSCVYGLKSRCID